MQVQPYLMFNGRCEEAIESRVMASDGQCGGATGEARFQGFSLSILAENDEDAKRRFDALALGGQVQMPLAMES